HHHSPFPPPPHRLSALNPTPTPTFSPLSLHDSLPISKAARLRRTASAVAQLDVLTAFAKLAADRGYACPEFNSTGELLIVGGRRSEEHTSELQSPYDLVFRLLLVQKNIYRSVLSSYCF